MKIVLRKKEFIEFMTVKKWALMRRRVSEIPAYLQPIGFGFSLVKSIKQGFWLDKQSGQIYMGFLKSESNFHYFSITETKHRSDAYYPEPALIPLSYREGYLLLCSKITKDGVT